jgi:hypothetical protein
MLCFTTRAAASSTPQTRKDGEDCCDKEASTTTCKTATTMATAVPGGPTNNTATLSSNNVGFRREHVHQPPSNANGVASVCVRGSTHAAEGVTTTHTHGHKFEWQRALSQPDGKLFGQKPLLQGESSPWVPLWVNIEFLCLENNDNAVLPSCTSSSLSLLDIAFHLVLEHQIQKIGWYVKSPPLTMAHLQTFADAIGLDLMETKPFVVAEMLSLAFQGKKGGGLHVQVAMLKPRTSLLDTKKNAATNTNTTYTSLNIKIQIQLGVPPFHANGQSDVLLEWDCIYDLDVPGHVGQRAMPLLVQSLQIQKNKSHHDQEVQNTKSLEDSDSLELWWIRHLSHGRSKGDARDHNTDNGEQKSGGGLKEEELIAALTKKGSANAFANKTGPLEEDPITGTNCASDEANATTSTSNSTAAAAPTAAPTVVILKRPPPPSSSSSGNNRDNKRRRFGGGVSSHRLRGRGRGRR